MNLGCLDLNPWAVRRDDLDRPDKRRVDLDPQPDVTFAQVRVVALLVRELLAAHGISGFPRVSGSRGMYVVVPIEPSYRFTGIRRRALALARELERPRRRAGIVDAGDGAFPARGAREGDPLATLYDHSYDIRSCWTTSTETDAGGAGVST